MKHAKAINNHVLTTDCSCSKIQNIKVWKKETNKIQNSCYSTAAEHTLVTFYEKCKEIFLAMKVMNIILLTEEKNNFQFKKISPITFYLDVTLSVQH